MDDKGRLKLPAQFQEYLAALPEKRLFATSLDRRTARIYPVSLWRESEKKLRETQGALALTAKRARFNANDLGAGSEMDSQGRVLLSPELRRELGIENQNVHIMAEDGRIDVMSETVYAELKGQAAATPVADVEALEMAGIL